MAISDKKLRQVYSTLQKGGYGEDYDTFMRGFAGNENYQNRKNVYDLLKGAGADIGDTYEDFIGNLQSDNKGSGNYVYNPDGISPVEEKKEEVQPVINVENTEEEGVDDATFADYMRGIRAGMRQTQAAIDRTNKAVEYGQKNLGPNVKPAKLDIADNRNVIEEEVYNPETMQMEKQYTTSYGGTYQDKFSAKQEQDKIDLRNRFDSLQRDIEKERQSVYAEVDAEIEKLQKQIDTLNAMKKDGDPKQVEGYRQQAIADLENKIADLQEKRGEFDKEAEFRANKFLYENSGMKEQVEESLQQANDTLYEMNKDDKVRQAIDAVQKNSPFLVLRGAAAGAENLYDLVKRWSNPEYGKAVATQRKLSDAAKTTETVLGKDDSTWMTHLLRGAWDGATDIRTWDFGINDMTDMGRLYQLQAKADRIAQKELAGEESEEKLTASEQKIGTHDVGVEALFLQGVVLGKTCLIDKVHGFLRSVLDVLVIRGKGEEELVEHFHMTLGFHIQRLFHRTSIHENRHISVKDIDLLVGIIDHCPGCPDAGDTDDDAARQEKGTDNQHQLDFVFEILYNHSSDI